MNAKLPRMAERIEFWETEKLKPYEKNPRLHSDEQISQLAASFIRFGMVMPILVDKDAGVIAGHGRLEAAKLVGLEKIPVVVLDNLTDEERRVLESHNAAHRQAICSRSSLNGTLFKTEEIKTESYFTPAATSARKSRATRRLSALSISSFSPIRNGSKGETRTPIERRIFVSVKCPAPKSTTDVP